MIRVRVRSVLLCLAMAAASCASASAHVDRIIRLEGKALVGLPAEYSPAELDLEALRLRIGDHVMEFPPPLRGFFERQPYDLVVSASWFHDDDDTLPPYLLLGITPEGRDYSYSVVLALDTLRLLDIRVTLRGPAGPPEAWSEETLHIALRDDQKEQFERSVKRAP